MAIPPLPTFAEPTDGDGAGNFPGGGHPWSGQPLRSAPAAPYFTPGTAIAAEEANSVLGTFADFMRTAFYLAAASPALNWGELQVGGVAFATYAAITGASWDDVRKRWLVFAGDAAGTGAGNAMSTAGFGDVTDWASLDNGGGLGGQPLTDVTFDGTNYIGIAVQTSDQTIHCYTTAPGRAVNWGAPVFTSNAAAYVSGRLYQFGPNIYALFVSDDPRLEIRTSVTHGASWTSSLVSLTVGGDDVLVADNGTFMVVMPKNSLLGYYTGSDGAWAMQANPFGGKVMQGLVFAGGVFVAVCSDSFINVSSGGDGGNTYVYQSPDGVTWTLVKTLGSLSLWSVAAASAAGVIAAITYDQGAGDGTGAVFGAFSLDLGVTWYRSQFTLPHEAGTALHPSFLRASPTGFFAGNYTTGRFSTNYGLPAAPLT